MKCLLMTVDEIDLPASMEYSVGDDVDGEKQLTRMSLYSEAFFGFLIATNSVISSIATAPLKPPDSVGPHVTRKAALSP